jgi:sulfite exporter TauE/SafE
MPVELTFAAALIVGLLGSTHCLGMCSGIVAALNMGIADDLGKRPVSLLSYQLAYNAGRICSYVLVGLLAGTLGAGLAQLGVSPVAGKLFAAAFMIALGLYLANWWRGLAVLERLGAHLWRHIQPLAQRLFPIQSPFHAFLLGGLWGWLPCGLVYAVVAWSLTTSNTIDGAILMLGFGLGTLPAMLLAGKVFSYLATWVKAPVVRTSAGVLIMAFGIYNAASVLYQPNHQHHNHSDLSPASFFQQCVAAELARVPAILRKVA